MTLHSFYEPQTGQILHSLDAITAVLDAERELHVIAGGETERVKEVLKFPTSDENTFGDSGFWVHGLSTDRLELVLSYLDGDAHDVSKVQWFNGSAFYDLITDPNIFNL